MQGLKRIPTEKDRKGEAGSTSQEKAKCAGEETGRLSVIAHYNYTLRFRSCGLSRGAYGSALRTRQGLSALCNPTKE